MITVEELQKLKLANTIIDRGSRKLGVRPLYASAVALKRFKSDTLVANKKLNQVASRLSLEKKSLGTRVKSLKKNQVLNVFIACVSVTVLYFGFLVFNPGVSNDKVEKVSQSIIDESVVDQNRALIITTGDFKSEASAEKLKNDLSERLGVPLQIIKDHGKYTVQIGPSYQSKEDALLVFDELSQYSIGKLSLRFAD